MGYWREMDQPIQEISMMSKLDLNGLKTNMKLPEQNFAPKTQHRTFSTFCQQFEG